MKSSVIKCKTANRTNKLPGTTYSTSHRRSLKGDQGAMGPHKFSAYLVIFCSERRYPKLDTVARLK